MSNDNTYNGFEGNGNRDSAWATWNVCLWVDNEEWCYNARRRANLVTAEDCEAFFDEMFPEGTPDMEASELVDVNWQEVANHWADDED